MDGTGLDKDHINGRFIFSHSLFISRLQRRKKSPQMLAISGIIRTGAHQTALNKRKLLNNGKNTFDDRYNRNKLVFTATGKPHWVEELNDDFDDMDEDIESYRCTCN